MCVAGAGVSDDDGGGGVRESPTPDLRPSSPALHSVDTIHYAIVNYYRVWDYIFFADAEQPWTAARRRRVPDDVSHTMFYGVFRITSLMDYRHGVPLFLVDYTWIPDRNGLQTNWIYTIDIRLHCYRLCCYSDVISNVSHKLFDSLCAFITAV